MGMEVCCTLGMIEKQQAEELKKAGLTAYNHNLDTSREYYPNVITTRSYDDRLQTLQHVREAGISICSGDFRVTDISSFLQPTPTGLGLKGLIDVDISSYHYIKAILHSKRSPLSLKICVVQIIWRTISFLQVE
jgi:hypothetical protein